MARKLPVPSATTQREWVGSFARTAPDWLKRVCREFARGLPNLVLDRRAEEGEAAGLVAMVIQGLDAFRALSGTELSTETRWLEELWLWGSVRWAKCLFSPRKRAGPSSEELETTCSPSS
ncbi:MAG: hypothetical protein WC423_24815 [Vulcanimicrobiota bacterium]